MLTSSVRVVLVCGIRLYREAMTDALNAHRAVRLLGTAPSASAAATEIARHAPDVVLLDPRPADEAGAVRLIADQDAEVVLVAAEDAEERLLACVEAGASGFVMPGQSIVEMVDVLQSVSRGEMPCSPRLTGALLRRLSTLATEHSEGWQGSLTTREIQIAELIDRGLSNKQIARELCIEVPTVKSHVHNILEKLQVHRRGEAAAWLRRHRP